MSEQLKTRTLGRTGLEISEVGFGAWSIGGGWGVLDDAESKRALHRYLDLGGRFIDTAYGYGDGHSEQLIGEVVRERGSASGEAIVIASKVPPKTMQWPLLPHIPASESYPVDWVMACAERSLKNLGTETIDLLQLHAWTDAYNEQLEWYEALERLREQGKVRYFGVSINDYDPESGVRLAQSERVDAIQVIYNIFEQNPEKTLFPAAMEHGVGILARVPFEEGALTGAIHEGISLDADDWRREYFTAERVADLSVHLEEMTPFLDGDTPTLASLALKFCLHHPAVTSVLPGMRRERHVDANVRAADHRLSPAVLDALRPHAWDHGWRYPWCVGP